MQRPRLPELLALVVLAAGCGAPTAAPEPAPAAFVAPRPVDKRTLALAEVDGSDTSAAAVRMWKNRLGSLPDKPDLWIELGRAWVRKARMDADPGYYLHAAAAADVALELSPDNPEAMNLHTLVALNRHAFAEARDQARRVLARDPDNAMALGSLSDALLELGDMDGAEEAAQAMIDRKPNLPSYVRASWLRWLRGDVEGALEAIRLAIDAGRNQPDPEPPAWTMVEAANIFWHEGDLPGAEAGYELALGTFPEFPAALVGKAKVALARGDAAAAVRLLEQADQASPQADTAWLLGDARAAAGDAAGAERAYAAVRERGRQGDARTLALFLATRKEDPAEALRIMEAEKQARGGAYTDDAYAWALLRAGRVAEAKKVIDPVVALGTRDARVWFHAGAIGVAAGDVAGGAALLRKALAQNPAFDRAGAAEARALLAGLPAAPAAVAEAGPAKAGRAEEADGKQD